MSRINRFIAMADGSNRPLGTVSVSTSSAANTPSTTPRLASSIASPLYFSAAVSPQQLSSPLMLVQQTAMVQQGLVSADNQLRSVRSPAPSATLFPVAHPAAPQYRLIVLNAPVQASPAAMGSMLTGPPSAAQQQMSTAIRMQQQQHSIMQPSTSTVITANQQNIVMPISSVSPVSGLSSPPVVFSPHQQQQQQQQSLNLVNLAAAARAALPQQMAAVAAAQTSALIASGLRTAMLASAASQQQNSASLLNQQHQQTLAAFSAAAAQQQQQQMVAASSRQIVVMPDGRSYSTIPSADTLPRAATGINLSGAQPVVSAAGLPFVCFAAPTVGPGASFPSVGVTPSNILSAATRLPTTFQQQALQMQSFTVGTAGSLGSQPILLTPVRFPCS